MSKKHDIYHVLGSDFDLNYIIAVGHIVNQTSYKEFYVYIGGDYGVLYHFIQDWKLPDADIYKEREELVTAWKRYKLKNTTK